MLSWKACQQIEAQTSGHRLPGHTGLHAADKQEHKDANKARIWEPAQKMYSQAPVRWFISSLRLLAMHNWTAGWRGFYYFPETISTAGLWSAKWFIMKGKNMKQGFVLRSSFSLFSEERSSIIIIILFWRGSSNGFTTTTQKQMNISDNISAIKCHWNFIIVSNLWTFSIH